MNRCASCSLPSPVPDRAERLKAIYEHTDGFVICREDLRIRGPRGVGARQSSVPLLRYADLEADAPWSAARDLAESLLRDAPQGRGWGCHALVLAGGPPSQALTTPDWRSRQSGCPDDCGIYFGWACKNRWVTRQTLRSRISIALPDLPASPAHQEKSPTNTPSPQVHHRRLPRPGPWAANPQHRRRHGPPMTRDGRQGKVLWRSHEGQERLQGRCGHHLRGYLQDRLPGAMPGTLSLRAPCVRRPPLPPRRPGTANAAFRKEA